VIDSNPVKSEANEKNKHDILTSYNKLKSRKVMNNDVYEIIRKEFNRTNKIPINDQNRMKIEHADSSLRDILEICNNNKSFLFQD